MNEWGHREEMKIFYLQGFQPQITQPIAQSLLTALPCLPTTTLKNIILSVILAVRHIRPVQMYTV
jgi:hypothetical protein